MPRHAISRSGVRHAALRGVKARNAGLALVRHRVNPLTAATPITLPYSAGVAYIGQFKT